MSSTTKERGKCCSKCFFAAANQGVAGCLNFSCECHSKQEKNYERDYSHMHCWESKKPPCGQRIEHLKCCLCEMFNPIVNK